MANKLYQAMKVIAKANGVKASPQNDLYKMLPPYFLNAFYYDLWDKASGVVSVGLRYEAKYQFFDDLELHIIEPDSTVKLTDKVRANSVISCRSVIEELSIDYDFDGRDESYPILAERVFQHIENWYRTFFKRVDADYDDLEGFFVSNKDRYPRQAALIYLHNEDYEAAEKCLGMMQSRNISRTVRPLTDEQRQRAVDSGAKPWGVGEFLRDEHDCYLDYVIAMRSGLEWTADMASFGLLREERGISL